MSTVALENKTILVTGAAGFIGSNLVKRICEGVPSAKVVGIDSVNDYYDVALKEFRLNELSKYESFTFIKGNIANRTILHSELDLKNPKGFNEKLQWLKIYDRKAEYTTMVDKYAVKQYVAEKIGEQYIIPTLGIWKRFDDIDFDSLPNQFVLKCTHDSGGLVVCKDKNKLDKEAAKAKIERSLKKNYYWSSREWPYKNVPPRIIAEKYMFNSKTTANETESLKDYKFYCFNHPQYRKQIFCA